MLALLAAAMTVASVLAAPAQADAPLPRRAVLAGLAHDESPPAPTPAGPKPPPPGPGYCQPPSDGPPSPPNAIFGTLTLGGAAVAAGTLVTLTFDGSTGPSAYTEAAGGYRVFYAAGGQGHDPPCTNAVGALMGITVAGQHVESGVAVGDVQARLAFRFDVVLP